MVNLFKYTTCNSILTSGIIIRQRSLACLKMKRFFTFKAKEIEKFKMTKHKTMFKKTAISNHWRFFWKFIKLFRLMLSRLRWLWQLSWIWLWGCYPGCKIFWEDLNLNCFLIHLLDGGYGGYPFYGYNSLLDSVLK